MFQYSKAEAIGTVILRAGSIVADRFDMNIYSTLRLEGGILVLNGNHVSKIQGHLDAGRIVGVSGLNPKLVYDEDSGRTYLYTKTDTVYTNYYGLGGTRMLRNSASRSLVFASASEISSWFEPSSWQPSGIPGQGSECWMNSADTSALIGLDQVATASKLIVGRKVGLVSLIVDGGELLVGDDDSTSAILFVGQYSGANGKIVLKSGRIKVHGELAIGVSGPGSLDVTGGRINVHGRLVVGRYDQGHGNVILNGGDIYVERLDINSISTVDLQEGRIYIKGDSTSKLYKCRETQIIWHKCSRCSL